MKVSNNTNGVHRTPSWVLNVVVGALMFATSLAAFAEDDRVPLQDSSTAHASQVGPLSLDDHFAEVSRRITGFAGAWIDENGYLVVSIRQGEHQDAQTAEAAAGVLAELFGDKNIPDKVRVASADYSFAELIIRYEVLRAEVLAIPGVAMTDIDESVNRIVIGLEDSSVAEQVWSTLDVLGVPLDIVQLEETGPIEPLALTLQDEVRPLEGGLQIQSSDGQLNRGGFSTFSFNAYRDGVQGFVTCSHCTLIQGMVENSVIWQHKAPAPDGTAGDRVGIEWIDPPYVPWPRCPLGRVCRYSDTAWIIHQAGDATLGGIKRTKPLDLDIVNSWRITAESSSPPLLGTELRKVGRTTATTSGPTSRTCFDVNKTRTNLTLFCQYTVAAQARSGVSGSPVFRLNKGVANRDVELHGVLWGVTAEEFVFSHMNEVQRSSELGPLLTCDVGFGC